MVVFVFFDYVEWYWVLSYLKGNVLEDVCFVLEGIVEGLLFYEEV